MNHIEISKEARELKKRILTIKKKNSIVIGIEIEGVKQLYEKKLLREISERKWKKKIVNRYLYSNGKINDISLNHAVQTHISIL